MTNNQTLEEAKQWLRDNVRDGVHCPCCEQFAKIYRRKLNSAMACMLIEFYRYVMETDTWNEWNHIRNFNDSNGGDFAKLRYWNLIFEKPNKQDNAKKTSGYWKISEAGKRFAENIITLPSHMLLYDSKLLKLDGEDVDITHCLGKNFNYRELMND